MLAATAAEGVTVIHGAAREPEISALASYLRLLGSRITGDGTDTVTVEADMRGECRVPDHTRQDSCLNACMCRGGDGRRC